MKLLRHVLICFALIASADAALGQSWPQRPVKLIVPTGPGAATDVMARLLADGIGRTLGVTLAGLSAYVPWLLPAVIGLPLLVWRIRKERARPSTSPTPLRTPPPR